MVLIISKDNFEYTTDVVIDWLHYYGIKFMRLNAEQINGNFDSAIHLSSDRKEMKIFPEFLSAEYQIGWFRRWSIPKNNEYLSKYLEHKQFNDVSRHLGKELMHYSNAIFDNIKCKFWIDKIPKILAINKLSCLHIANYCGLRIPETLVTSDKTELMKFLLEKRVLITKPISDVTFFENKEESYLMYTNEVNEENYNELRNRIFYSLFQEKIEKKYEIRVFVLGTECYSMAIFSQKNVQTVVDFRHYDIEKPNRNVPYHLPKKIKKNILRFMKEIGLNSGSIDLIKGTDDEYYFLEVNPVGQFGMVSKPCNYYLEKKFVNFIKEKI